ncbi:MFS transporter [Paenibacillus agricola]|uniref:MFS transporter n=1 Tax=Paenibacillus agricola TaxID=2716264 RepID=A0ABX0IZH6_9BACL|nr:MFS transporter [Paenibacillus agricola]NHN29282.1 MFS transporter [Paenibacillus agricola]
MMRPRTNFFGNQVKILLVVSGLFAAATALSVTFVSVYLWKARHDYILIGWFTLVNYVTMGVVFWLAGKWVKEQNKMNCLRAGIGMSACFYMLVLWLGDRAVDQYVLLGTIQGAASGLFWVAFNVVYFEVTDPDNRDRFNGWTGLLGSGTGMVAPWISGYLIVHMEPSSGYRLIFTISLLIFLLCAVFSFFLKKRKTEGTYEWLFAIQCLMSNKGATWRPIAWALLAQGIREGVFGFMIALLVYVNTGSEMMLGNFALITSGVALVSFMVVGKLIKKQYRGVAMGIGALMIVLVIIPFFWKVNLATLLTFGVGVGMFFPLYSIPMTSTVFDTIGGDAYSVQRRAEFVVLRELALNAGRITGLLLFIAVVTVTAAPLAMNILLLGIGSSPLIAWFFMRKLHGQAAGKHKTLEPGATIEKPYWLDSSPSTSNTLGSKKRGSRT